MKTVAFLSRFALICNILFVFCLVMRYTPDFIGINAINGTIVILGLAVAPLANVIVCVMYASRLLARKPLGVKNWLVLTNFLFLIAQLFLNLILVA